MPFTNDLIRERMRQLSNELMTLEVHNGLRQSDGMPEDEITERVELAKLNASRLIEMAGYDLGDSDRRGMAMDEAVVDLLTVAFLLIGPEEVRDGVIDS